MLPNGLLFCSSFLTVVPDFSNIFTFTLCFLAAYSTRTFNSEFSVASTNITVSWRPFLENHILLFSLFAFFLSAERRTEYKKRNTEDRQDAAFTKECVNILIYTRRRMRSQYFGNMQLSSTMTETSLWKLRLTANALVSRREDS